MSSSPSTCLAASFDSRAGCKASGRCWLKRGSRWEDLQQSWVEPGFEWTWRLRGSLSCPGWSQKPKNEAKYWKDQIGNEKHSFFATFYPQPCWSTIDLYKSYLNFFNRLSPASFSLTILFKQTLKIQQEIIVAKMSIQNTVAGFEPTTSTIRVSSHNH